MNLTRVLAGAPARSGGIENLVISVAAFAGAALYWRFGERIMAISLGDSDQARSKARRLAARKFGFRTGVTGFFVLVGLLAAVDGIASLVGAR